MDSQLLPLATSAIGLVLGVLLAWLLIRGRIAAAIEQGKAEAAVVLLLSTSGLAPSKRSE